MRIKKEELEQLSSRYGNAFYLLDVKRLKENYRELEAVFQRIYSNFKISYSYKTNYIPRVCKVLEELGGYAEVVSHMECELAKRLGIRPEHIVLNGPCKEKESMEWLLLNHGIVNIDSMRDFFLIKEIAKDHPDHKLGIGIRCNFEIGDGVVSRFGIDVNGEEFAWLLSEITDSSQIWLRGLHCHFASRNLEYWPKRAARMIELAKTRLPYAVEYISLGGGIFGKMPESLKQQFDSEIPSYSEYAEAAAAIFQREYDGYSEKERPLLMLEPGSALAGDVLRFACRVLNIKDIRGKKIATAAGSMYNINPTLNGKNPPLSVVPMKETRQQEKAEYDIAGYTCIESDYLYRNYRGGLSEGDFLVFDNAGSYSVVLKPPFILPNVPILEYQEEGVEEIKRAETFDDIFHTYQF